MIHYGFLLIEEFLMGFQDAKLLFLSLILLKEYSEKKVGMSFKRIMVITMLKDKQKELLSKS
jgi:hypothetical protein